MRGPMPFPDYERVIYQKNPLNQVICQLRYPPILRIDTELPAGFQERIRHAYPELKEHSARAQLPPEISRVLPAGIDNLFNTKSSYEFISEDGCWTVSLTRDFLALSTTKYRWWEEFKEHLSGPVDALLAEYAPLSFFTRIGLRYQNVIWPSSNLGLTNFKWSDLLAPYIAGPLTSPIDEVYVVGAVQTVLFDLKDNIGQVRMQHGLVKNEARGEAGYKIDNDFFSEERTEIQNAFATLDQFHRSAGRIFRWCITETLHTTMGPDPI
jgi:uncharacterized protein (TIGR04255 family)